MCAPCALRLQEVLEVQDVQDVMRCALLCLLEMLEVQRVTEVMRHVLLCMREAVEAPKVAGMLAIDAGDPGRDVLCATLFAGCIGGAGDDALCARYYPVCWRMWWFRNFHRSRFLVTVHHETELHPCFGLVNLCPFRDAHFFH